jgi:hypothetical protein
LKVKALSFRQPWAELVVQGRKTLDLRTWSTRYRGPLAVYASQTVEQDACLAYGLDPGRLTTGAVVGLVELAGVVELDAASYAARAREHLDARRYRDPLFGWELTNPRRLCQPQPARGRLLLFEVELDAHATPAVEAAPAAGPMPQPDARPAAGEGGEGGPPFELRVVPEVSSPNGGAGYRLAIYQRAVEPPAAERSPYRRPSQGMERMVELGGAPLRAVADRVLEALRRNGYRVTDLGSGRREPFSLEDEWGVRLGLLFLAVKPVSKIERVEAIAEGLRDMTSEELYYWYSKCTSRSSAERAQKALRMLLADE